MGFFLEEVETKLGILYYSSSLECVYLVLYITLVPPVKPVSPVVAGKEDIYLQCLCTSISYGAGASDWEIMFGISS